MKQEEIENGLRSLMDDNKKANFNLRKGADGPEAGLWIEANRNGILVFCNYLLKSVDREYLTKESGYDIPDGFYDDSEVAIHYVEIMDNEKPTHEKESNTIANIGCGAVLVACVLIFIAGLVSTFQWLTKILE